MDGPLPLDSRSITVLYATVTGTAADVAERIGRQATREGWSSHVQDIDDFDIRTLPELALVVFVLSTTGQGAPPATFVPLWTFLLRSDFPSDLLIDTRFAVFALGDSSYAKYNWVGKKMYRRLEQLGATPVINLGEGDDQNEWGVESTLPQWIDQLIINIHDLYPLPPTFTQSSKESVPLSKLIITKCSSAETLTDMPLNWSKSYSSTERAPATVTLSHTHRVTPDSWFQDVREFKFTPEKGTTVSFKAGDVLEIKPCNSDEDVQAFLKAASWSAMADDPIELTCRDPQMPLPHHWPTPYRTTLRHLIKYELDITSIPKISFFEYLSFFCSPEEEQIKEKLDLFASPQGQDELLDYANRPRRTIIEVMYEFRTIRVPVAYVFDILPLIRPRQFSIANTSTFSSTIDLLVGIVEYRTNLQVPRKGLCTTYMKTLKEGDTLHVRFNKGTLASNSDKPYIMVGPGTGVAPFRALMQERYQKKIKENILFFGFRNEDADFYYESEWKSYVDEGYLQLFTAPSRYGDKVYVQDRIAQQGELCWNFVSQGGSIFICGSSNKMPKAVKKAFLGIFQNHIPDATEEAAEAYWDTLERQGRIIEESWS